MKTVKVFLGADMRCSHSGLIEIANKNGVYVSSLQEGEALLFINHRKNRLKSLSWNGVLSYVNFELRKQHLDLDAISEIPRAISPTGHMDYKKALRIALEKKLGARRFVGLEML